VGVSVRAPRERDAVGLLVTLVAVAATAGLAVAARHAWEVASGHPEAFGTFLVLTLLLQVLSVPTYRGGSVAVSAIGLVATGIALGAAAAMAVGVLAALAQWVRSRGLLHRAIFDTGNFALSAAGAALAYRAIAGTHPPSLLRLAAALAAAIAYSALNNGLLCAAIGLSDGVPMRSVWAERFQWATPHYLAYGPLALAAVIAWERVGVVGVVAFACPPALLAFSVHQYLERTRRAVEEAHWTTAELKSANARLLELTDTLRKTNRDLVAALCRSMEANDVHTAGHSERVADIAFALGRRLGYEGAELEAIEIGALLHDIGKIGLAETILAKEDSLEAADRRVMAERPLVAEFILSGIDLHPFVLQIARSCHERLDGRGYPDGLSGDAVPLPARIVHVADAWDALTSSRPYRRAQRPTEALAELRANAGTQFCPRVVAALEQVYSEQPHLLMQTELHVVGAA
jgi:hypothetical protein